MSAQRVDELTRFVETELTMEAGRGGVRNLLGVQGMRALAEDAALKGIAEEVLGAGCRVVRGTLFDKTEGANWKVPWHQDVTIEVQRRVEMLGYGPWSVKAGVLSVQPPSEVMNQMLTLRLHLDDCLEQNGALKVLPGSHVQGKLSERVIETQAAETLAEVCTVGSGGVLVMRPLLIHASSAATLPGHRRVLHFDYASCELPDGIGWAADVQRSSPVF